MRSTKNSSLLAAAAIIAASAGIQVFDEPYKRKPATGKQRRVTAKAKTEIELWNEAVEARKAEKKARKALNGKENQS